MLYHYENKKIITSFNSNAVVFFPVLYNRFSLVIYFIHSSVYMSIKLLMQ